MQRLRSLRHRFWYGVSERVRWSRGAFHETPALELPALTVAQAERITALRNRYQVHFERTLSAATALNNYEYLDILDRAWESSGLIRPDGGTVYDVGCASFWYASSLVAFFIPREIVGVEIEGHRLFKDGRTRIDYAAGYLADFDSRGRFVVADYLDCEAVADVITAWFPFLTAGALLAWRLPLSMLAPGQLFVRIRKNLSDGGVFVMVNHGETEAELAHQWCDAANLQLKFRSVQIGVLSGHRKQTAILSCWSRR